MLKDNSNGWVFDFPFSVDQLTSRFERLLDSGYSMYNSMEPSPLYNELRLGLNLNRQDNMNVKGHHQPISSHQSELLTNNQIDTRHRISVNPFLYQ